MYNVKKLIANVCHNSIYNVKKLRANVCHNSRFYNCQLVETEFLAILFYHHEACAMFVVWMYKQNLLELQDN